jgi:hypothetical protein
MIFILSALKNIKGYYLIAVFGSFLIAPDRRMAYIGSNITAPYQIPVAVVDLYKNQIVDAIMPYSGFRATYMLLGPVPGVQSD